MRERVGRAQEALQRRSRNSLSTQISLEIQDRDRCPPLPSPALSRLPSLLFHVLLVRAAQLSAFEHFASTPTTPYAVPGHEGGARAGERGRGKTPLSG